MIKNLRADFPIKKDFHCSVCGTSADTNDQKSFGEVNGNTTRFKTQNFSIWKCQNCHTLHSLGTVDFADIYKDYPVNLFQTLDFFAKGRFRNLLKRLRKAGLKKELHILDFGCGNGIFADYLRQAGYQNVTCYDPYVEKYAVLNSNLKFDFVLANDVFEHVEDPHLFFQLIAKLLKPKGIAYIGTADSDGVKMDSLSKDLMKLHQPFHRLIVNQKTLVELAQKAPDCTLIASYKRSYMDTIIPFVNYRFLDEFNKALGHEIDLAFKPDAAKVILKKPLLLFYAYFGYFFPSAFEPAVIIQKNTTD